MSSKKNDKAKGLLISPNGLRLSLFASNFLLLVRHCGVCTSNPKKNISRGPHPGSPAAAGLGTAAIAHLSLNFYCCNIILMDVETVINESIGHIY
jgi:hypothetical protein